jgi:hypothetical protein
MKGSSNAKTGVIVEAVRLLTSTTRIGINEVKGYTDAGGRLDGLKWRPGRAAGASKVTLQAKAPRLDLP